VLDVIEFLEGKQGDLDAALVGNVLPEGVVAVGVSPASSTL
jgi:hypothetical protein